VASNQQAVIKSEAQIVNGGLIAVTLCVLIQVLQILTVERMVYVDDQNRNDAGAAGSQKSRGCVWRIAKLTRLLLDSEPGLLRYGVRTIV